MRPLHQLQDMENAIDYIGNHSEIREVILTGGDPLSLSDNRLGALLRELDEILIFQI